MLHRYLFPATLIAGLFMFSPAIPIARACCPVSRLPVINADQTVIILWNPATQMEHFIRQASFKSEDKNLGFIIPSPSQPQLSESGDNAFETLAAWTAPQIQQQQSTGCGCSKAEYITKCAGSIRVLNQKRVAGFDAVVLEADSPDALATWLKQHGYELSPAVAQWAAPYIRAQWKFTALKVADTSKENDTNDASTSDPTTGPANPVATVDPTRPGSHNIHAAALRMSFKTDRPLFPYREPTSTQAASTLGASDRLLHIYFLSDARYEGTLTPQTQWTGRCVWANQLKDNQREQLLSILNLTSTDLPTRTFLTEFEDRWPYRQAPADLYFSQETSQKTLQRPAMGIVPGPGSFNVVIVALCGFIAVRARKRPTGGL